jgi:hypothetical protein
MERVRVYDKRQYTISFKQLKKEHEIQFIKTQLLKIRWLEAKKRC